MTKKSKSALAVGGILLGLGGMSFACGFPVIGCCLFFADAAWFARGYHDVIVEEN